MHIRYPEFLNRIILDFYVRTFDIDVSEASKPLAEYTSLAEFFVRDLKNGVRPVGEGIVSPVDGDLRDSGSLQDIHTSFLIKGSYYTLSEIVGESFAESEWLGATFFNLYLSPRDYHHIHAPADVEVHGFRHIPGTLWPVNDWALANISFLFAKNERVVLRLTAGEIEILLVLVGAFNVGSISLAFEDFRTQVFTDAPHVRKTYEPARLISKGERLATFHMGSSVLMFVKGAESKKLRDAGVIKLGESLFR